MDNLPKSNWMQTCENCALHDVCIYKESFKKAAEFIGSNIPEDNPDVQLVFNIAHIGEIGVSCKLFYRLVQLPLLDIPTEADILRKLDYF